MKKMICKLVIWFVAVVIAASYVSPFLSVGCSAVDVTETDMEEMEKLYYGYDVTGGKSLMANDALQVQAPIIDKSSGYSKHISRFSGSTEQQTEQYASASVTDIVNSLNIEIAGNIYGKIYGVNANLEGIFGLSKRERCSEYYEVCTSTIIRHYYVVQLDVDEIRQYLSPKFISEASAVSDIRAAEKLFKKYGTHLNTGYSFGGKMVMTDYKSTNRIDKDLTVGVEASFDKRIGECLTGVEAGIGVSGSFNQKNTIEDYEESYKCTNYGGVAIPNLNLNDLFARDKEGNVTYSKWVDSINANQDLTIIGIPNGAQSIPLWDLLEPTGENAKARQCLVEAYIEMCGTTWNDFMGKYPDLTQNIKVYTDDSAYIPFDAYIKTPNDFFYPVKANDLQSGGDHNEVHPGDTIYLQIPVSEANKYVFEIISGGTAVDRNRGIFRVGDDKGMLAITGKLIGTDSSSEFRFEIPIKKTDFEGGSGKGNYPYLITNCDQFRKISSAKTAHYRLVADLDFDGGELDSMGTFSGVLDGNYCTVSGFLLTANGTGNCGIFCENEGTIKYLRINGAGTSRNVRDFNSGGKDSDRSICAKNAGIICGKNNKNGVIEGCYFSNDFIRNVVTSEQNIINGDTIKLCVGIVTGINNGNIIDCMAENCSIWNAFENKNEKKEENKSIISVYTGGMIGLLSGGCINSCVCDSGNNGTIMSFLSDKMKNSSVAEAYATYFAGFCDSSATVNRCYIYCRGMMSVSTKLERKGLPSNQHALSSPVLIVKENTQITTRDVYAYAGEEANTRAIMPDSGKEAPDSQCKIINQRISSEIIFNNLGLTPELFRYNSSSSSVSHVSHILSDKRENNVRTAENNNITKTYSMGECFSPWDTDIQFTVGGTTEKGKAFRISLYDGNDEDPLALTEKLAEAEGRYYYRVSAYADGGNSVETPITVGKVKAAALLINNCETEYDIRENFLRSFDFSSAGMKIVLSDGTSEEMTPDSEYVRDGKLSVKTEPTSICAGENKIRVIYTYGGASIETDFMLNVIRKEIIELTVSKMPDKTNYSVGENVDLTGMELRVLYSDDTERLISGEDVKNLEVIGNRVGYGKNDVTLVYSDYSKTANFSVNGIADAPAEESRAETDDVRDNKVSGKKIVGPAIAVASLGAVGTVVGVVLGRKNKRRNG